MKRLIATYSDKGGVGKSMTARLLAETLITLGRGPLLVDADSTVGHLVGYLGVRDADGYPVLPQPSNGVRTYALHGSQDDRVEFGAILDEDRDLVLVDLPAASATLLRQVEADYGLMRWAHEAGYAVTLLVPITPDDASMLAVQDAAELDPMADIVVARNSAFGDPARHFIVWDGSEAESIPESRGKAIVRERGLEIVLPALDPATLALVGAYRLRFGDVAGSRLIGSRQRQVARFLDDARVAFESCGDLLGVAPANRKRGAA